MKKKSINDTDEFYKELAREGKVKNLNEPKHMKAVREVNETGREAKMEFPPRSLYTKAPHCCPVCGGNGKVLNGFYDQTSGSWQTSSLALETCRSCNGTGIIWG